MKSPQRRQIVGVNIFLKSSIPLKYQYNGKHTHTLHTNTQSLKQSKYLKEKNQRKC